MGFLTKYRSRLSFLWRPFNYSFVAVPLLSMILNALLASLLSLITTDDRTYLLDQGLRMIGLVSNASISIVTLTFSLTVLSVQIAAQSYSPRLLDEFIKDPVSKVVISVNLGSYVYCFTLLYFIDPEAEPPDVPYVAINFLTVHIALVLITFINFIHLFINGFRIEAILSRAAESSLRAAKALSMNTDGCGDEQPEVPSYSYKVMSDKSGYVTQFTLNKLVKQAQKMDICIRYNNQIGEFVNRGTLLCYVWDAKTRRDVDETENMPIGRRVIETINWDDEMDAEKTYQARVEKRLGIFVSQGVVISKKRSSEYDVTLGIQQLSDIAVRALSPGVNDPHSAIQCMDVLSPLFANLATMDLGVPNVRDGDGNLRLCAPQRSFSYLLSMLDSIRLYGGSDLDVCRRGLRLFGDLGEILTRTNRLDRLPPVLAQLEQWMLTSQRNFEDGSPEVISLQELYDHLLRNIADSKTMVLRDESGAKDLQTFETTFFGETETPVKQGNVVMEFLKRVTDPQQPSQRVIASATQSVISSSRKAE